MSAQAELTPRLRDLFEAAGELSAAEDEDAVFDVAIRKARQLVGTDLAYVMLLDREHGDTYMRAVEGAVSPRFDTIRLGMGLGLGGQVAEAMAPRWTRNYVRDTQYTHVIDPIVIDEGVLAILGVPVKKHGRLTGILFASDRTERDFSQEDITLLALLADHISVALTAAGQASRRQDEINNLQAALAAQRMELVELSASVDFHERLTRLVVAGAPVSEIVNLLVELEGGSVSVLDASLREIGSARAATGPTSEFLRSKIEEVVPTLEEATSVMMDDHIVIVAPVVTGLDHVGYIAHARPGTHPDTTDTIARVSSVIALILLGQRARDEADNRVRGELLAELLATGNHDLDSVGRRAALLGVDVDSDLVALVAMPPDGRVSRLLQEECSAIARAEGGLVTAYGDRVALLLPGADAGRAARELVGRLSSYDTTVGASGPTASLTDVTEHVERAWRAAKLLVSLGREGDGASTEELGVYGLLFSEVDRDYIAQFIEHNLGPVQTYDRTRGTALLETLSAWYSAEANASTTANLLFVHVNTVYQRLDRLDSVLGPEWRSGDRALELRLALRLWDLMAK